jgi:hypothetical protein
MCWVWQLRMVVSLLRSCCLQVVHWSMNQYHYTQRRTQGHRYLQSSQRRTRRYGGLAIAYGTQVPLTNRLCQSRAWQDLSTTKPARQQGGRMKNIIMRAVMELAIRTLSLNVV